MNTVKIAAKKVAAPARLVAPRVVKQARVAVDTPHPILAPAAPGGAANEDGPSPEDITAEPEELNESDLEQLQKQAKKVAGEDNANFLSMYFREMARLSVLRPQEEFDSARQIEELELALWSLLLRYAPGHAAVMEGARELLPDAHRDLMALEKALGQAVKKKVNKQLPKTLEKWARQLRAIDIDKLALDRGTTLVREALTVRLHKTPRSVELRTLRDDIVRLDARLREAKNQFVKANLRLVVSIARRFNYGRMPLPDLIQEGNIGLMKAVERYDYRRGFRFSTYASWWIRHAISRALADKGRAVRLPVHMIDTFHRLAKLRRDLSTQLGRQPTSEELGQASGIPTAKLDKMRTFLVDEALSLDRPVNDEDGRRFIDLIVDPDASEEAPTDRLVGQVLTDEVRVQLEQLRPIEADILRQRFGLGNDEEQTLKEIGEKYRLSRERIRQLQEQALAKMRRAFQRKDLI